jgi:hypothetical protein
VISRESRIDLYCTLAIWQAMDGGPAVEIVQAARPSNPGVGCLFLEFATAMHSGELGRLYD